MLLRFYFQRFPIIVICIAGASYAEAAKLDALFTRLPSTTYVAVGVDHLTVASSQNESGKRPPEPDVGSQETGLDVQFGIDRDLLARAVVGGLARVNLLTSDGNLAVALFAEVRVAEAKTLTQATSSVLLGRRFSKRTLVLEGSTAEVFERSGPDSRKEIILQAMVNDYLLLTDDLEAAKILIPRLGTSRPDGETLPRALNTIRSKLKLSLGTGRANLVWYLNPWPVGTDGKPLRSATTENAQSELRMAQRHGLRGVQAVAGIITWGPDGIARSDAFVDAPRPLQGTLQLFGYLKPANRLTFSDWISGRDIDVALLHMELPSVLKHVGHLFDDAFADGMDGTYEQVLDDMKSTLNTDLPKDLYPLLGPRVIIVRSRDADTHHQPILFAFEASSSEKVARVFRRLMQDDPDAKQIHTPAVTDVLWHVPSVEQGGSDFVLAVVHGYGVYSNDIRLMRRLLNPNAEQSLGRDASMEKTRRAILADVGRSPCLLFAQSRSPAGGPAAQPVQQGGGASPSDMLFYPLAAQPGGWTFDEGWLPADLAPYLEPFRLTVGFSDPEGWRLVSRRDTVAGTTE